MTWRELLTQAEEKLKNAGVSEYGIDAWYLFSEAFDISRAQFFLCRDREIPAEVLDAPALRLGQLPDRSHSELPISRFAGMVDMRCRRIPLQQIIGHQEFMGLDFLVNEHVLCPRQDTEVLVETVLGELAEICTSVCTDRSAGSMRASRLDDGMTAAEERNAGTFGGDRNSVQILDMCAGSGCIGISLERLADVAVGVVAADISEEAIKVARANAEKNGCEHYRIMESDLFEEITGKFHVIVSNPPYIPSGVIETLSDEVRLHEPRLALDGEADGLSFYRRISEAAVNYLVPGGRIYYEIGYDQGEAVSEILAENGFTDIRVIRDLAGLDRVVVAKLPDDGR